MPIGKPDDVLTEITIRRPLAEVSLFASDPDNAPLRYVNIKRVEWKSPKPLAPGSRVAFVAHFLGKRLSYTWESIGASETRMTLRNRGMPAGFSKLFAPFMARAMRTGNRKDLELLKTILEQNPR